MLVQVSSVAVLEQHVQFAINFWLISHRLSPQFDGIFLTTKAGANLLYIATVLVD